MMMVTRRKWAVKVAQQTRHPDPETSDTETVATQAAFEDSSDSEFECQSSVKATPTTRKRLASSSFSATPFGQGHASAKRAALVERQPTRRPDPNVSNRNALMARENRKKKKEQLESLGAQNDELQRVLRRLQKTVGRQEVIIRGLRNERNYLKSVLENQSEISRLLKQMQSPPQREQQRTMMTENGASPNSVYSDSGMSFGGEESPFHSHAAAEQENLFENGTLQGTSLDDFNLDEDVLNADLPLISTDLLFSAGSLDFPTALLQDEEEEEQEVNEGSSSRGANEGIRYEHNYVNQEEVEEEIIEETVNQRAPSAGREGNHTSHIGDESQRPGICFHIRGGGKVSLEFCSKCHESATREAHFKRL